MPALEIDNRLTLHDRLYRYVSLPAFISLMETGHTVLTNVNEWEDKWEAFLSKVPTVDERGDRKMPSYSFHEDTYGQCWSLVAESDAMWRIYSPDRSGLRVESSVARFHEIGAVGRAYLGQVTYFDTIPMLLELAKNRSSAFDDALFKRGAFRHEREVRFLTHSQFLAKPASRARSVSLPVPVSRFIEGVQVDPRAHEWFVEAVTGYCKRAGLACHVTKSTLYEPDPHLTAGVSKQYVPVTNE